MNRPYEPSSRFDLSRHEIRLRESRRRAGHPAHLTWGESPGTAKTGPRRVPLLSTDVGSLGASMSLIEPP